MAYNIIQPPFRMKFREMPKSELKAYFQWFLNVIPSRIAELANAVRESPDFEDWRPDYTPKSLEPLGSWLAKQVDTRPRMAEELQDIAEGLSYPEEVSASQLTNRTISLAMDVGMYLSQVFLRNHPSLKWDQPFGSKRFIDYRQPVLMGFRGKVPFIPV
jgi:hypothetical protein